MFLILLSCAQTNTAGINRSLTVDQKMDANRSAELLEHIKKQEYDKIMAFLEDKQLAPVDEASDPFCNAISDPALAIYLASKYSSPYFLRSGASVNFLEAVQNKENTERFVKLAKYYSLDEIFAVKNRPFQDSLLNYKLKEYLLHLDALYHDFSSKLKSKFGSGARAEDLEEMLLTYNFFEDVESALRIIDRLEYGAYTCVKSKKGSKQLGTKPIIFYVMLLKNKKIYDEIIKKENKGLKQSYLLELKTISCSYEAFWEEQYEQYAKMSGNNYETESDWGVSDSEYEESDFSDDEEIF